VALAVSGVTREKNKVNLNTTAATAVSPADGETPTAGYAARAAVERDLSVSTLLHGSAVRAH
jgi:hypothetical protein